jgi:hypothetical protein
MYARYWVTAVKQATISQVLLGNGCATDMNVTIALQEEDTTIMGNGVLYAVSEKMVGELVSEL